ncbi:ABC transporter ATP-binding protein [Flexibacterium corallicola]|uniref:ABC transporter ATP-binding protein n=1 Tax=Flexibacterium corallicola TaxID=3037259 RepID=UPI00286F5ADA|nr:ABC transporter ATP-binding protein [Pseudovibrio sp. M1P-2-3]
MRGMEVTLNDVSITYPNGFTAVHPTSLTINPGEFFSILGPSGCGKTTLLRSISGFVEPTEGQILIGGTDYKGIGPNGRPTALIFQNLALFPLMSVWENVAFGLEARGISKRKRREKAEELLELVALHDQADKKPTELSGGQRQRVAIARALAVEPAVLLLDEPLSALDLKLRQHMRTELRAIQKQTGVTFIYITHDQGEALTMSDRIAVMNEGRVQQVGSGDEVYSHPETPFVASFVGEVNHFHGRVSKAGTGSAFIQTTLGSMAGKNPSNMRDGEEAILFVRPENMRLANGISDENAFEVRFLRRDLEGPFVNLYMQLAGGEQGAPICMQLPNNGALPDLQQDERAFVAFDPEAARVLSVGPMAKTGREELIAE